MEYLHYAELYKTNISWLTKLPLFKSPKSCFSFENIEALYTTPYRIPWQPNFLSQELGKILFSTVSLENNFPFTEHTSSDTIILCFYSSTYYNELLELHLTGVKSYDFYENPIIGDIHLTLRCKSPSKEKNCSYHYCIQSSNSKYFRFILNENLPNNQTDLMSEYLGQQGYYNFSSAVFQPILSVLESLVEKNKVFVENKCIKYR